MFPDVSAGGRLRIKSFVEQLNLLFVSATVAQSRAVELCPVQ